MDTTDSSNSNTGDQAHRTYNLNLACWVPDLFIRRVEQDASWSLFDPKVVPRLPDLYGEESDRAYELTFYPISSAAESNLRWRPVGLGIMGLQDVFFRLRLAFDAPEARALSRRIAEHIYFHALDTSCAVATERGPHPSFSGTRAARGKLQ